MWVGFFGGWSARRYGPDGVMTDEVRFPVSNITKIALGGPDGRTAYATTARQGLSEEQLAEQVQAGDIFTFRVEVPAKPLHRAAIWIFTPSPWVGRGIAELAGVLASAAWVKG